MRGGARKISRRSDAFADAASSSSASSSSSSSSNIFSPHYSTAQHTVVLDPTPIDFGPPRGSPQLAAATSATALPSPRPSSRAAIRLPQKRQFTSSSAASGDLNSDTGYLSDTIMADASNTWRTGQPTSQASSSNGNGVVKSSNRGKASKAGRGRGRGGASARDGQQAKSPNDPQPPQTAGSSKQQSKKKLSKAQAELEKLPVLPGAPHSMEYLTNAMYAMVLASGKVNDKWVENPKNPLSTYFEKRFGEQPNYTRQLGRLESATEKSFRVTVEADRELGITGYGDAKSVKDAERLAAFDAVMQLAERDLLNRRPERSQGATAANGAAAAGPSGPADPASPATPSPTLTSGIVLTLERAREFMDFYCHEFRFGKPVIQYTPVSASKNAAGGRKKARESKNAWQADMIVGDVSVGKGVATNKKQATQNCYIDTVLFIEQSDPQLYARFHSTHKPGAPITAAAHVYFRISDHVHSDIQEVIQSTTQSLLYSKRPHSGEVSSQKGRARAQGDSATPHKKRVHTIRMPSPSWLAQKSDELMARLQGYQTDERVADMRRFRNMLPVTQNIADILTKVALHQVSICMAATGSGKSTQVPQILLDDAILEGKGAECNIICTQPRRIAAISLAQRVANERGEQVGDSVGYQVRFEQKLPRPHGSITFCTTGSFMKRLQNALGDDSKESRTWLDTITHIVIDEVHERDVQTDLLLVVLKKVLQQRRAADKREIKLILMSATVDPKLFQNYFPDRMGRPAPVVEIPGRAFPVERYYMEQTVPRLQSLNLPPHAGGWVWQQKNVKDYLHRELQMHGGLKAGQEEGADVIDDLEIPYPLVALYIADAMTRGEDGHVLVFLPGWDEIKAVLNMLQDSTQFPLLGLNFNDRSRFEIHILHSTVPVADQQAVFSPPPQGVRRVILSTNIAETSVTIPDVTVVVDTGRVKEMRYDPSRHLSSLVSAWVGTSNLSQRAGRAGRHRPGEYFGVLSKARHDRLAVNQTVEMQRAELTDVVLHIKALDLAGMEPEEVLASAIEPPSTERVQAAMEQLYMIGALDTDKSLTSLGHLLLQLPVNAAMGKMILYGLFFRCVEPTVTLAAILTSREPFLSSIDLKVQVSAAKESWSPSDYRSDALATLRAYQAWSEIERRGDRSASMRFCHQNYLHQNTLFDIQRLANHLVQSLQGIIGVIIGSSEGNHDASSNSGRYVPPRGSFGRGRLHESAPELNRNSNCTPLLACLIAMASTPNFAVRKGEKTYQTSQDKATFISPSSVCHPKHIKDKDEETLSMQNKDLFTFAEKSRNVSQVGGGGAMTMLRTVTRLDPLTFMVFGSHQIRGTHDGLICDDWLPMRGFMAALWDVNRLKHVMEASMLRVFEGIGSSLAAPSNQSRGSNGVADGWDDTNDQDNDGDAPQAFGDRSDLTLARREVDELKELIDGIVRILDGYASERASIASSRNSTRPSSPGVGLNLGHSLGARQGQTFGGYSGGRPASPIFGRVGPHQPSKPVPRTMPMPSPYDGQRFGGSARTTQFGNGYPSPAPQNGHSHSAPAQGGPSDDAYAWW